MTAPNPITDAIALLRDMGAPLEHPRVRSAIASALEELDERTRGEVGGEPQVFANCCPSCGPTDFRNMACPKCGRTCSTGHVGLPHSPPPSREGEALPGLTGQFLGDGSVKMPTVAIKLTERRIEAIREDTLHVNGVPTLNLGEFLALLDGYERTEVAEARVVELKGATDRLVTIVDEAFGLQPVMPLDDLLTALERLLYERRVAHDELSDHLDRVNHDHEVTKGYRQHAERELEAARARVGELSAERDALRMDDQPWNLAATLGKLIEAADALLKHYDGHGWEEINHARDAARRLRDTFPERTEPTPSAPTPAVDHDHCYTCRGLLPGMRRKDGDGSPNCRCGLEKESPPTECDRCYGSGTVLDIDRCGCCSTDVPCPKCKGKKVQPHEQREGQAQEAEAARSADGEGAAVPTEEQPAGVGTRDSGRSGDAPSPAAEVVAPPEEAEDIGERLYESLSEYCGPMPSWEHRSPGVQERFREVARRLRQQGAQSAKAKVQKRIDVLRAAVRSLGMGSVTRESDARRYLSNDDDLAATLEQTK